MPPTALTPLALENAPLLRQLAAQDFTSNTELAEAVGRDLSNLNKTLKRLEAEGLVHALSAQLTAAGANAVRDLERLDDGDVGSADPEGSAMVAEQGSAHDTGSGVYRASLHAEISPDPNQPRKHFDPDKLAELATSIASPDGLLEPIVLRPDPADAARFLIVAGERRWRAIGQAIFAGAWAVDRPIPTMVRRGDEATIRRLALVENLQRDDLNPIEEARAIAALQELTGASAAQLGRDLGFTERWAQQRLSLLKLPDALQARVDAGEIKVEEARQAAAIWDKLPPIKRKELEKGARTVADVKRWHDNLPKPLSDAAALAICEILEKVELEGFLAKSYSSRKGVKIVATPAATDSEYTPFVYQVDDPAFEELAKRYIIDWAEAVKVEGIATGEHYTEATYQADYTLRDVLPAALKPETRKPLIAELRVKLHGLQADYELTKSGRYATAWLNPEPVELSAEQQAQIAENRSAREAREAQQAADRQARDEAAARAHQARADRIRDCLTAESEGTLADPAGIQALANKLSKPLPWFLDEQLAMIIAANGTSVTDRPWNGGLDLLGNLRLIVTVANAAAGLATPSTRPDLQGEDDVDDDDDDQIDLEDAIQAEDAE